MKVTDLAPALSDAEGIDREVPIEHMKEPYLSRFCELVRSGAGVQDIHGCTEAVGYAATTPAASEAFLAREIGRVRLHQGGTCRLLEHYIGKVESILDVGCSTGGLTVALALSRTLQASKIIGVDPNHSSLQAAEVRAKAYDLSPERVEFAPIKAGEKLPFADDQFDLTVCVSVLEFIPQQQERQRFLAELQRITRVGGYIFLATPTPYRLREIHSRRLLGNFIRRSGFPWASSPRQLRSMFPGCAPIPLRDYFCRCLAERFGSVAAYLPAWLAAVVVRWASPWQKFLVRKTA